MPFFWRSEGKFVIAESLAALDNLDWKGVLYQLAPNGILVDKIVIYLESDSAADEITVRCSALY